MDLMKTEIGVTTVCPGITNTGIVDRPSNANASPAVTDAQRARMRAYYAKNGATPESIAEAVVRGVERGEDLVLGRPPRRGSSTICVVSRYRSRAA